MARKNYQTGLEFTSHAKDFKVMILGINDGKKDTDKTFDCFDIGLAAETLGFKDKLRKDVIDVFTSSKSYEEICMKMVLSNNADECFDVMAMSYASMKIVVILTRIITFIKMKDSYGNPVIGPQSVKNMYMLTKLFGKLVYKLAMQSSKKKVFPFLSFILKAVKIEIVLKSKAIFYIFNKFCFNN